MTHGTDSSTRLDDHDPRDPAYADEAREEAHHGGDETDRDTDTELDAAARPDATDTVDDEAREGDAEARESEEAYEGDWAVRESGDDARDDVEEARADEVRNDHDAREDEPRDGDEVGRGGDPFGVNEATRERDAFAADEAEYEAAHGTSHDQTTGDAAREADDANRPTAVATAPVNAAVPEQRSPDEVGAHEAGTDRDAVEAVDTENATGTVYGTATGTDAATGTEAEAETDADDRRADNGPIVAGTGSEAPPVHDEMKPGSVEPAPVAAFWNDADAEGMRERWRELQLRFIDDPESVAREAERLVEEAVASLTAALSRAKQELGDWRDGQSGDTERLRAAVRSYRDFLDRLLGL